MSRFWLAFAALIVALGLGGVAKAQEEPTPAEQGASHEKGEGAKAEHEGAEHEPGEINWFTGLISEKEGAEPGLLFRPKGMQPPLGGMLINSAILFYLVFRLARRPMSEALKKRKTSIMQGIDAAAKMKKDAANRLAEYEDKLAHVDQEIERVKREMREAGQTERVRILEEAKERRTRMERDARLLVEQELKAARQEIMREAVESAVKLATERLTKEISEADQQRLADEYLAALDNAFVNAKGGRA